MAESKAPPPPYRKLAGREAAARSPKTAIDVAQIDHNINQTARKQVSDALKKNPELVLSIIRGWKSGDR